MSENTDAKIFHLPTTLEDKQTNPEPEPNNGPPGDIIPLKERAKALAINKLEIAKRASDMGFRNEASRLGEESDKVSKKVEQLSRRRIRKP